MQTGVEPSSQTLSEVEQRETRKLTEILLRMVPMVRRMAQGLEANILHRGAARTDTSFIRAQGTPSNETMSKAVRLAADGALCLLRERLALIDNAWRELPRSERAMTDVLFWSEWRDLGQTDLSLQFGYSTASLYRLKVKILDHFAERLGDGCDMPSVWFGLAAPED